MKTLLDAIQDRRNELTAEGYTASDFLGEVKGHFENLTVLTQVQEVEEAVNITAKMLIYVEATIEIATREFHVQRQMFAIMGDCCEVCEPDSPMSHAEWFEREGWALDDAIRGYSDFSGIYAYRGSNWYLDNQEEVERFKLCLPHLIQTFETLTPTDQKVYNGVIPGLPGTRWEGREYLGTVGAIVNVNL